MLAKKDRGQECSSWGAIPTEWSGHWGEASSTPEHTDFMPRPTLQEYMAGGGVYNAVWARGLENIRRPQGQVFQ